MPSGSLTTLAIIDFTWSATLELTAWSSGCGLADSSVADQVKSMMASVVSDPLGTAHASAQIPGVHVYAKTGTAQNGINNTGLDDAVFTCFAQSGSQQIAVGVVVKGGGQGADAAAPVAVQVIKAYLGLS